MKFLKAKTLSKFSPTDQSLFSNLYGRAVMELSGGIRLPKGTTAERPNVSGVRTLGGPNGFIRYNTDTDSIEAYVSGVWETVRAPGASTITKQTLGPGNEIDTIFGPLNKIPNSPDNIIVLVENVFQISSNNYNVLYNYLGSGNAYIEFTSPVPLDKYVTVYFGYSD
jgi:hypothetical protein